MNEQCDEGDHLPPSHWYWNLRFTHNSWELKKLNYFWRSSSGYKIDGVIKWMINLLKKSPYKKTNDCLSITMLQDQMVWEWARGFQTDSPVALFLNFTVEGLLRSLLEKFILKVLIKLILKESCLNQMVSTFINLIKLILDLLLCIKLQNIKRKQHIKKLKHILRHSKESR